MKKFLPYVFFFSAAILIFSSCSKKCKDFNNDIINWMPYAENDNIVIRNSDSHETLVVTKSERHHTKKIRVGEKCACSNTFNLILKSTLMDIDIAFYDSDYVSDSYLSINDDYLSYAGYYDQMILNGLNYTDVIVYKLPDNREPNEFKSVYISKYIGILKIEAVENEWIILDSSNKEIDPEFIPKNVLNC